MQGASAASQPCTFTEIIFQTSTYGNDWCMQLGNAVLVVLISPLAN